MAEMLFVMEVTKPFHDYRYHLKYRGGVIRIDMYAQSIKRDRTSKVAVHVFHYVRALSNLL